MLLVYPASAAEAQQRAEEFLAGEPLPANVKLAIDPDFKFTNQYHLRWDEAGETAYPSTFVIDTTSRIVWAKIGTGHGDRSTPQDIVTALQGIG